MNERIKELVEQTRQDCMRLGVSEATTMGWDELERFAELVRQDEREACAKLCDYWFAATAGQAIRERGNK